MAPTYYFGLSIIYSFSKTNKKVKLNKRGKFFNFKKILIAFLIRDHKPLRFPPPPPYFFPVSVSVSSGTWKSYQGRFVSGRLRCRQSCPSYLLRTRSPSGLAGTIGPPPAAGGGHSPAFPLPSCCGWNPGAIPTHPQVPFVYSSC